MLTHLICCIHHSDVIPFVISIFRVLTKHTCVLNGVWGNIRVWLHIGGMGYIAQPLSVLLPTVAVRFSGTVSCVCQIAGFIILSQLFQHIHRTVLLFILHVRYQVLRLVS